MTLLLKINKHNVIYTRQTNKHIEQSVCSVNRNNGLSHGHCQVASQTGMVLPVTSMWGGVPAYRVHGGQSSADCVATAWTVSTQAVSFCQERDVTSTCCCSHLWTLECSWHYYTLNNLRKLGVRRSFMIILIQIGLIV